MEKLKQLQFWCAVPRLPTEFSSTLRRREDEVSGELAEWAAQIESEFGING
jgi:hypothetical protein